MSDYGPIGDAVVWMERVSTVLLCVAVPLAVWKLLEVIVWLCHHVTVVVTS